LFTQVLNILKHKLLDKRNKKVMALVKEVKKELRKY
jgi:preprotein translocase subunit SecE